MNKKHKVLLILTLSFFAIILICFCSYLIVTKDYYLEESKLVNQEKSIVFYDDNNKLISEQSLGRELVNYNQIPKHVKNAFISTEDKRFYKHNGIDLKGILRATFNNIKSLSFREGGSTISQQLIKNTHLSNEKTIKRKLAEIKLTTILEKNYSKDQIMAMYLNTIYFGDGCYGIKRASNHYYNKEVEDLTISEGALLAGMIKSPAKYSLTSNENLSNDRKNVVLENMFKQGFISENEYISEKQVVINSKAQNKQKIYTYIDHAIKEIEQINEKLLSNIKKLKVFTYCDIELQNQLERSIIENYNDYEKCAVLLDKNNKIKCYASTCYSPLRQSGSTLKPIGVFAPALEENLYYPCSILEDKKTDFYGYSPSNYNDIYRGKISFKDALSYSSNVCAVKILNTLGVDNSLKYLNKFDLELSENDKNLALGLGATYYGQSLNNITSCYSTFINDGYYSSPTCIKQINVNNKTIYKDKKTKSKVFSDDTAFLMNDILSQTVKQGTAKKLSYLNKNLCAKTGTVGNSTGNTDGYCISYNPDAVLGFWFGVKNQKENDSSLTGGTYPTSLSAVFWDKYFKTHTDKKFIIPNSVKLFDIDLTSYKNENIVELANEYIPKKDTISCYFRKNNFPIKVSKRNLTPIIENIETIVKNNVIQLRLCLPQSTFAKIYLLENDKRRLVFDSYNANDNIFNSNKLDFGKTYQYVVVPYYKNDGKETYGNEIFLSKIKLPTKIVGNDDWFDDLID